METLSINFLIKDSPTAVAIIDNDMCFMSHSRIWLSELCKTSKNIIGKSYYEVLPETPTDLRTILRECLQGKTNINKGHKFIHPNGRIQWLKWKINPWKYEDGTTGGIIIILEDITEQKRDEELLLKAESVARIGGWEVDLATSKVYWTSITKEIHEVPEDYVPNLEEGINFYKAGEHRENITKLVSEAISDGTPWDIELIIVTAKGKELWVRAMGDTEVVGGTCVRIFGTFQDIDEKKRAELKYQEVTTRLKIATEAANVGVWDYNIEENKLVWDENMYRLYGINKDDFIGEYEAWQAGLHPDDKRRGEQEVAMAVSGEKEFNTEFRVIWPSGEIRHIRAIAVTQRNTDGEAIKMIGTNWDITELKNTQLQLIKTEESLQGTFENSSIGMALVGLDGKWAKVNESLCNSVGYTEDEILKLTFQDITHPDDLAKDLALLKELIDGKRESYQIEKRYHHKNGHIVYVLLTVTAVKNINGEISHFISQIVDITSRIEAEKN
ncbi:PAS domain-containing protein [Maribacter halichondriae]|uniref:PAS domain-containing protein n=1 Tax=Maribacter halichondriae TaxID=2980554 RepID=UPI0023591F8A|nr:GGDEF and EAL domain-containing protein [Maribacter sp. Hal144]